MQGESAETGYCGVVGKHTGTAGFGVFGEGRGTGGAGVSGQNPATGGYGVQGEGFTGVRGKGAGGYGGLFEGGKAQMRIVPKSTVGRPTNGNHAKGEVYMDSAAALWVCTVGGTPGTWRKITTTA